MTDLHDKARNLLALREKATPGPWLMRWKSNSLHKAPPPNTPYTYGDFVITVGSDDHDGEKTEDVDFIAAAHDMADIIAALLAENERLTLALDGSRHAVSYWTEQHAAAEARLRELASAEAVRYEYEWFDPGLGRYDGNWGELRPRHGQTMEQKVAEIESYQRIDSSGQMYRVRALIPRPSMEGKP